jgi:hypothetical protein
MTFVRLVPEALGCTLILMKTREAVVDGFVPERRACKQKLIKFLVTHVAYTLRFVLHHSVIFL